ncbi:MAG: tetratricopeptide repeat protein [Candidatus Eiseniibacteriota bacterium]
MNRSLWCAAVMLVAVGGVRAADAASNDADPAIERGNESYARGRLREALAAYQGARAQDASSYGALVGLARVESELGEEAKDEERRRLIASAVEHARAAVKAAPDEAHAHVWLAVALRQQAETEGPKTRAGLWREIKSELDRAIGLDAGISQAYLERGRWHRRLATRGLWERAVSKVLLAKVPKGASKESAVRDLEKAVELAPQAIEARMELARTYLELERDADARRELERALAMPANRPRDPGLQAKARELLEKLAKRG